MTNKPSVEYRIMQIVTIAKFRRPHNPVNCQIKLYHVWRWRETMALDPPPRRPPSGMKCQCGALTE